MPSLSNHYKKLVFGSRQESKLLKCQVVISAALYLKLKGNPNSTGELKEKQVARIADMLNFKGADRTSKDPFFHLLMKSNSNIEELVFMRPINVRLKFITSNHSKSANSKEFIFNRLFC